MLTELRDFVKCHKTELVTFIIGAFFLFSAASCEPKTQSLADPMRKVTATELQIELEAITRTAEYRLSVLEQQYQIRELILRNALLIAEGNPTSPAGIATGLLTILGASSAISTGKKAVKQITVKT